MRPGESFVQQPVRSLQTMLRVIAEDDPSLPTVVPDGIYGPSTMVAVTAFQRKSGIPVTGIVDEITWDRIAETYEPALIRVGKAEPIEILLEPGEIIVIGQSSPYVYLLQGMLAQLSGDHQTILYPALTGTLDTDTADSLRAFQLLAGLPATGTLDKITWRHLVKQFTLNAVHNSIGKRS
jgi:peptidoglycan hydrolase-like protein with peptidoglycan-binding domain